MNEREEIISLMNEKPKHYSKMIKNRTELWNWVLHNTKIATGTDAAMIYSAVHQVSDICDLGNTKRFSGVSAGFTSCGTTQTCQCAKNAVSASVAKAKANRSREQIEAENAKRISTSLQRYGVTNNAQTNDAKLAHSEFYLNKDKVAQANEAGKNTKITLYGSATYNNREQAKKTTLDKYGVENPMQHHEIAAISSASKIKNYDPVTLYANNYLKFVVTVREVYGVDIITPIEEYQGVASRPMMKFKCPTCNHVFEKRFDYGAPPICKCCNPTQSSFQSKEELEVFDYIRTIYTGNITQRDRSIINPYELDIVLPDKNIAIEYCGLYWHSEISGSKSWSYHARKLKLANEKGYRLITIFSDEWLNKKEQVKRKLLSVIGGNSTKIGARKCTVKEVPFSESHAFHALNHIQDPPGRLGKNIGLYYNNELVALGSFVKQGNTAIYELVRFSSSAAVMGGASRVIQSFFNLTPIARSIISFADLRWSEGDMYFKTGFKNVGKVPAMQYYVRDGRRYHKRLFSRKKINPLNEEKTEWQKMQELGYDRIWDCGKLKFELNR